MLLKNSYYTIATLVLLSFFSTVEATRLASDQEMIHHLDLIHHYCESVYAPGEWKRMHTGWTIDHALEQAKVEIRNRPNMSIKEYQLTLKKAFSSFNDYHVGIHFFSTEQATLPFTVKSANGKVFITSTEFGSNLPFSAGDELVLFGGRPAMEVIEELMKAQRISGSPDTELTLAEIQLTQRAGIIGDIVPQGPIQLAIRSRQDKKIKPVSLDWRYVPEMVTSHAYGLEDLADQADLFNEKKLSQEMSLPMLKGLSFKDEVMGSDPNALNKRRTHLPPMGRVLWKTSPSNPFDAYIFESPSGNTVGFIRIHSYHVEGYDRHVAAFADIIRKMEAETDALVIDQLNNGGGSVHYLYALARMLTDQPMRTPLHRMKITQEDFLEAFVHLEALSNIETTSEAVRRYGETICGYPVDMDFIQNARKHFQFVLNEWNDGRYFTLPGNLWGVDTIYPSQEAVYSKPILFLINELDFSGGDFMPAILQDNHRATIFGSKTAGAGGCVAPFSYPNRFGVMGFSLTWTLAERASGQPIENLGVSPDIKYQVTAEDIRNGYKNYSDAVVEALEKMIAKD